MANRQPGFSEVQLQTLRLLAEGLSDKEIARRYNISDRTVHTRVMYIYRKLGARSRAHAVALWLQPQIDQLRDQLVQMETDHAISKAADTATDC